MNLNVGRNCSLQLRHKIQPQHMREVITYPLASELFALIKSDVEVEIDGQKFVVDIQSKQI